MDETKLPLLDHLAELRTRLGRALLGWLVGFLIMWSFREDVFEFLLAPAITALGGEGTQLQALSPPEIFFTYLKCAALAGLIVGLPVIFWQLWAFIAPGLYDQERRYAVPFVAVSTFLFAGGATFGYVMVFPLVFDFFLGFNNDFVQNAWTMREVFGFTTRLYLAFGTGFEMPVVVFFLALSGLMNARQLLAGFKYAVLICFLLGAILTPPDVISQVLLAGPLLILYLLGVGVAFFVNPGKPAKRDLPTANPPDHV
ncbi:MAG: twin-arginine translocase subunit TatC [Deltaproteobacteria bacterium]|nr:twin-arginine translocase subunit TatC [Deltaproteobacteria bacterium]MBW2446832.1 twin-arginine translocase subunit TatC [Deltaproteobacteria bacterium]